MADLPPDVLPAFLARLERTAAARYRQWSRDVPAWASELLACADAEDEIADRISAAFPITAERAAALDERLPAAREIYFSAFDGMAVRDQLRLQAAAERQGAQAWRSVASRASGLSHDVHAVLAACSALEERSADVVDALLDRPWPQPSGSVMEAVITHEADRPLEGWTTPTGGRGDHVPDLPPARAGPGGRAVRY